MYNIKHFLTQKQSPAIRLQFVVQTDGGNRFRNVLSKTFQMIYDMPIEAENYLATRKTIYLPRYTRGESMKNNK